MLKNDPVEMFYKESVYSEQVLAHIYAIESIITQDGIETIATAWLPEGRSWIISPIWCFEPKSTKTLVE